MPKIHSHPEHEQIRAMAMGSSLNLADRKLDWILHRYALLRD
jgi:hypothetical protein